MSPIWYVLIGVLLGQGLIMFAMFIGGKIREMTNDLH